MPYYRFDSEEYDEFESDPDGNESESAQERPSGAFEYESAQANFAPTELGVIARVIYDALVGLGAKAFRVRYDGGYDEGFSHPDSVCFANGPISADELGTVLTKPELLAKIRSSAGRESMWGNASEMYRKADDDKVVMYAMDELAYELASKLLGEGFGTGEYALYGALTADLATGEIADHKDVPKPDTVE